MTKLFALVVLALATLGLAAALAACDRRIDLTPPIPDASNGGPPADAPMFIDAAPDPFGDGALDEPVDAGLDGGFAARR